MLVEVGKLVASMLVAYSTHYGVAKVYNSVCIPDGFWGYIQGMLTTGGPICTTTFKVMANTEVSYSSIILVGVSRLILDVLPLPK